MSKPEIRSTTVIAVVRDGRIAMASDGQVTVGNAVMKQSAQKVRKAAKDRAVYGFAGGAADAMALSERLEAKLEAHPGNVRRGDRRVPGGNRSVRGDGCRSDRGCRRRHGPPGM